MELNPDVLRMLAMELDLPSIIKFCKTNKTVNKSVCQNNMFWRNKLYRDFPDALTDIPSGAKYEKIYKTYANVLAPSIFYVYKFPPERGKLPQMAGILGRRPSDFPDEMRQDVSLINIRGAYPKGAKFWVYRFSTLFGDNFNVAATKEKAINNGIKRFKIFPGFSFEKYFRISEKELRDCLDKNLSCQTVTPMGNWSDFIIKQFTIP